jgi:hypothetical protein
LGFELRFLGCDIFFERVEDRRVQKIFSQERRGTVKDQGARGIKILGRPALAVAGWVAAAAVAAVGASCTKSTPPGIPFRFAVGLPDSVEVANGPGIKLGLSHDGSQLAVVGI